MIEFNVRIKNQGLPAKTRINLINTAISGTARYAPDGFANFYVGPEFKDNVVTDVLIDAPGFAPYSYFGETGQLIVFKDKTLDIECTLTPSFKKPSRSQIINVKANLCNLRDSDDIPIFDDYIDELIINNPAKAEDWVSRLRAAGSTHIDVSFSGDYPANLGWIERYPIKGIDWSNDIKGFGQIIKWVQNKGFIPIVKLALDGFTFDPGGNGVGYFWGFQHMERIAQELSEFNDSVLWSTGFDGCFPTWDPAQTIAMLRRMRNCFGPKACLDTEFSGPGTVGYSHMGQGVADWTADKLGILDNFSIELMVLPPNPEGVLETADRLIKGRKGPYYLAPMDGIKDINICMYETVAVRAIRKLISPEDILSTNQFCASFGFTSFGNGQP